MSTHAYYLHDLGLILKKLALEASKERNAAAKGTAERDFKAGRALAYYEVISTMQQQAIGFGIPLKDLRLDDIDADRDLI